MSDPITERLRAAEKARQAAYQATRPGNNPTVEALQAFDRAEHEYNIAFQHATVQARERRINGI